MNDNNKKQSIRNPYTGKLMEMNTYSGKEMLWRDAGEEDREKLTADEYYDYWEDDRLYVDSEVNNYEK
jgi:hypothetical protein